MTTDAKPVFELSGKRVYVAARYSSRCRSCFTTAGAIGHNAKSLGLIRGSAFDHGKEAKAHERPQDRRHRVLDREDGPDQKRRDQAPPTKSTGERKGEKREQAHLLDLQTGKHPFEAPCLVLEQERRDGLVGLIGITDRIRLTLGQRVISKPDWLGMEKLIERPTQWRDRRFHKDDAPTGGQRTFCFREEATRPVEMVQYIEHDYVIETARGERQGMGVAYHVKPRRGLDVGGDYIEPRCLGELLQIAYTTADLQRPPRSARRDDAPVAVAVDLPQRRFGLPRCAIGRQVRIDHGQNAFSLR